MICRRLPLYLPLLLPLTVFGSLVPASAFAWSWQDLWKTPTQQLRESEASRDYEALLQADSPAWQGAGQYRTEDFAGAAETYAQSGSATDQYNRGTALTRAGDFDAALEAFDQVLAAQPEHEKALHNRAIAEQLKALQQQQQQNGESSDDQDSQQQDQESGDSESESGQSGQDQQSQQQQEQQQESGEQESPADQQETSASEQEQSQSEQQQSQAAEDQQQEQEQQQEQQETSAAEAQEPLSEDQQATEQWLRRIPDDPTGLLRRKLIRSHQTEYPEIRNSKSPW